MSSCRKPIVLKAVPLLIISLQLLVGRLSIWTRWEWHPVVANGQFLIVSYEDEQKQTANPTCAKHPLHLDISSNKKASLVL